MMRPPVVRGITIAALFFSALAHMLVSSGRAAADEGAAAEALAPGSWSVQFSVQPNFTLGSYSGSTLSLKRHLASGNALRFGVSVGLARGTEDLAGVSGDTSFTRTQSSAFEGKLWSFGAGAYYLWYARQAAPVHAYWGAGPAVSWSRGHDERSQSQIFTAPAQPPATISLIEDTRTRGWRVGVAAAAGIEWLVARRIGLFAEYGSSLTYSATSVTRHSKWTTSGSPPAIDDFELESGRWDFSGSGGKLGISAYY